MKYVRPIDTHVHLRGTEYDGIPFLQWGLEDAVAVGLTALFEMPNLTPNLIDPKQVIDRVGQVERMRDRILAEAETALSAQRFPLYYAHGGLTTSMLQLERMLRSVAGSTDVLLSSKVYCCHSTGNMGLLTEREQRNVWHMAVETGYTRPIVIHAEDHTQFGQPSPHEEGALRRTGQDWGRTFDPRVPVSHSLYQHEDAEITSAVRQCRYAREAGFTGTIVIGHTSSPDTVEAVVVECLGTDIPFRVMFEVTWHHLLLNAEDDYPLHGNRVKMNPPLRRKACQHGLLNKVFAHPELFMVGTDHAPHPLVRKDDRDKPASGIPALPFWPRGIELLRQDGMAESAIRRITFQNANEVFGLDLAMEETEAEYDPGRWERYGWNPFSRWG